MGENASLFYTTTREKRRESASSRVVHDVFSRTRGSRKRKRKRRRLSFGPSLNEKDDDDDDDAVRERERVKRDLRERETKMSLENAVMMRPSMMQSSPSPTPTTRGGLLLARPTTTTTTTFTKADLEETERDLLSQCERTRDGEEDEAIRAVVAGGEKEAIRLAVVGGERENVDDDDDDDDDDDAQERRRRLARDGRMVLKMARRKEQMDEFTYEREKKEKEEEEERTTTTTTTTREKLSEMNTESAKRTFELESKGWETEKTLVAEEEDNDGAQRIEEKEGRGGGGGIEEEEEEEEEDRTQRYGDAPTQTQTNNQYSNSAGQSRNDLFRASGIAGGGETIDPQGTQRAEPSFVEEEDDGREERATGLPVTTIAATQDNPEEEEEEEESEDDEDIEIIGTQVVASEDEEEEQQGKESEQDKEENKQQRGHNTAQMITDDTAEEPALEVEIEKEEEKEEEGAGEVLATPADKPEVKNGQPPPLPPRRENVGSVILATELSTGTQNVSATVPSGSTRMVTTVKAVASAAENALRKQIETRKKQAFGIESVAPQSLNPNSGEAEMQQTERNEEPDDHEMAAQHDGKGEQENDDDNHDDDDDDDDEQQQQQQHNQSPDLAEYFSQRVNATDDDEDEDEDVDEVVYRSQLTQQDDEGGVLHRPKNVKFTMPVILGDGEISSSEEEEDDRENVRDEEEEADEEEDDDDKEEMHRRKRKREIPLHAVRMSKRERKPKKFFDDTQRQEDAGIEGEEEEEEEKEKEEKEKEAQLPPTCMPRNTTRRRSARAATTTTTSQKTTTPVSNTRAAKKKKTALPTSKTPSATATVSSSSKGQTWSNYLPGCPKCRYSSCNACRPMHDRAINGDESAQRRVIKWNERREEKVTSASRSLGKKAKASNIRMRRTSSVHATARTIDVSLTPQKQISTATKSRKTADKRRKSTQSVQQQSRRRNSVEDSAEKTKSITGGGGGGKTTTALFSGLSFMITSMPSSRVVNEMRASITENGGCLLDNIPKFNSSKRVPARKQIVVLPTMNNNSGKRKETAKCLYARAIGARLCSVQWIRKSLEKNKIIENDDQYATQPTKLRFEGTSYMLLGNTFFQDEFSNLMLHAGANSVMTCGKMTKNALNQALRRAQDEGNEIHAIVIQSSEKLSREIKSALSESRKVVVRHDWLTESLQRGKILEFLDYVVHV